MLFLIPFLSFIYLPLSSLTFIYRIKIADNKYKLWYFIFLATAIIYLSMQFLRLMVFGSQYLL